MAKKNEKMISESLVREKLNNISTKVDKLVTGYEGKIERLEKENRNLKNNKTTKVKPVDLPGNIEVDIEDKYNTQPKDSFFHNYSKNYRMFRKEAFRNVMKSKLFWSLIVIIPMIMTFIEFVILSMAVSYGASVLGIFKGILMDLVNYFMIMPLLLLSLIIFPTYIAVSRENNQLKRFAMLGMSRKQIYWAYMRFTTLFLVLFIFLWLGPWMIILNLAANSIFDSTVFDNYWSIFIGFPAPIWKSTNNISIPEIWWSWLSNNDFQGLNDFSPLSILNSYKSFTSDLQIIMIDYSGRLNSASSWEEHIKVIDDFNVLLQQNNMPYQLLTNDSMWGIFYIDWSSWNPMTATNLIAPTNYFFISNFEGINLLQFIPMFLLAIVGINSVGFNKAMKVKSARTLMGWGIGIWIFSSFVQMSTGLLYKDLYDLKAVDNNTWNTLIIVLLFILKWMFLFSPVTIIIVGVTLVAGFINQPQVLGDVGNAIYDQLSSLNSEGALNGPFLELFILLNSIKSKEPLLKPNTTKTIFISLSVITVAWETLYNFFNKRRIISYETTR